MKYIILMAMSSQNLQQCVNEFFEQNPTAKLQGGPYCNNLGHYQAITLEEKQLLKD